MVPGPRSGGSCAEREGRVFRRRGLALPGSRVRLLDGGAHFYGVYETSDGKHVALAPIEPGFYATLLRRLGMEPDALPHSRRREDWPALKSRLAALVKTRTREEWTTLLEGTDACFAPVLNMEEAPHHPHNRARATFVEHDGRWQPNAAPRFSRTPSRIRSPPATSGQHTREALADWGFAGSRIAKLREEGAIGARV